MKISDNSEEEPKPAITVLKKHLKSPAKFKGTKRFVSNGREAVAFDKPLLVIGSYYFNYISIYLLSCMGLTLNSIVDCFVFLFVMIIVGYIYISNNMMYMNPVSNIMGFKVYNCILDSVNTNDNDISSIVVASKSVIVKKGETIHASGKQGFIYVKRKRK